MAKPNGIIDKQTPSQKLIRSSKVTDDKLLSNKLKMKADQSDAFKISKYIIEKVLLPKIFGTTTPKKKKNVPPPMLEPIEPPKQSTADAKKNATKTTLSVLRPRKVVKKKAPIEKEPTHKVQSTSTDDLAETIAKAEKAKAKRGVKVKPKTVKKSTTPSKDQIETIGDANTDEICGRSAAFTTADIQGGGGGDGDLIISEITVKFCRRSNEV